MRNKFYYFLAFIFLITGCADAPPVKQLPYFSLSKFLNAEIKQHQTHNIRLLKVVKRDDQSETREIKVSNWEHELKPFFESDIDKPAWHLAYECDTVKTDSLMQVVYVANDEKVPVRRMQIDYIDDQIQRIDIQFEKNNPWFSLKRKLIYKRDLGYQIKGEQDMVLSDPSLYEINVKFIH
jgi:hypothetical protein